MLLAQAVQNASHEPARGGVEFASEIVEAMDLFRAGKNDSSLKASVDDFRGFLGLDPEAARPLDEAAESRRQLAADLTGEAGPSTSNRR